MATTSRGGALPASVQQPYESAQPSYVGSGGGTAGGSYGTGTTGNTGTTAGTGNYGIDVNEPGGYRKNVNGYDSTGMGMGGGVDNHSVARLETIVDRILRRGPPTSSLGNPGPLGLAGFAATTFVLSCYNANLLISSTENVVVPLALWYGGLVQLLAGMWEYAANNTFGATAFYSYGAFWLSFATLRHFWLGEWFAYNSKEIPAAAGQLGVKSKDINAALGMYLMCWTVFTGYMFIASLRMSGALILVFGFLLMTFACLTAAEFTQDQNSSTGLMKAGGWLGIIDAWCAWYASAAVVINGTFGAQLLPIGVLGPLKHTTPGLPGVIRRRLTESKEEDEPIAAKDTRD